MKTNFFYIFCFLLAITLLLGTSCKKRCKNVDCANGACNEADGSCTCSAGWFKDATGKCTVQDACFNKDCGHGACNPADGSCLCDAGWLKDASGKCSIQDLCYNKDCGTHGTCNATNGNCDCDQGYQLNFLGKCDSLSRDKFLGTFNVVDQCSVPAGGPFIYAVSFSIHPTAINKVIINNYAGYAGLNADAMISGYTISMIPATYTANGYTYTVYAASSIFNGNSFTISYKVDQNGVLDSDCTAVYTKQ